MKNIEFKCKTYGWDEDNIHMNEHTIGHVKHYINNPLAIMVLLTGELLRKYPNDPNLFSLLDRIKDIENYIKTMDKRTKDDNRN